MTAGVVLRAEGIGKVYGGIVALDGVDFDVERGRVSVLIGENGAGKTTLMRILAGVETPTRGRLLLDDVSLDVAAGEVVGLYGLMGAGRTELVECLVGARGSSPRSPSPTT